MNDVKYHINTVSVKLPVALFNAGLSTKEHNLLSFYLKLKSIKDNGFFPLNSIKDLQSAMDLKRVTFQRGINLLKKLNWLVFDGKRSGYSLTSYPTVFQSLGIDSDRHINITDISNYDHAIIKAIIEATIRRRSKTSNQKRVHNQLKSGIENSSAYASISYLCKCSGFSHTKVKKITKELREEKQVRVQSGKKEVAEMTKEQFRNSSYHGDFTYTYEENEKKVYRKLPNLFAITPQGTSYAYTLNVSSCHGGEPMNRSVVKKALPKASNKEIDAVQSDIERRFLNFLNDYRLDLINSKIISVYYSDRKIPSRMYSNIIRKVLNGSLKFYLDGYINIEHEIQKEYVEVELNRFNENLFNALPKDVTGKRAFMIKYSLGVADEEQHGLTLYPAQWRDMITTIATRPADMCGITAHLYGYKESESQVRMRKELEEILPSAAPIRYPLWS